MFLYNKSFRNALIVGLSMSLMVGVSQTQTVHGALFVTEEGSGQDAWYVAPAESRVATALDDLYDAPAADSAASSGSISSADSADSAGTAASTGSSATDSSSTDKSGDPADAASTGDSSTKPSSVEKPDMSKCETLFIADSYGWLNNGVTNWPILLAEKLGLSDDSYGVRAVGGSSFSGMDEDLNLKPNYASNLNVFDASTSVKTIIVAGGYNDRTHSLEQIVEGMRFFKILAMDKFPNAKIYCSFLAGSTVKEEQEQLLKTGEYYQEASRKLGITFLAGCDVLKQDNLFMDTKHPNQAGSTALAAAMAAALTSTNPDRLFDDVPDNVFYSDPVAWAYRSGITTGTDSRHFSPAASCTRAQAMTFLWKQQGSPDVTPYTDFIDVYSEVFYAKPVSWGVSKGITSGVGSRLFGSNQSCTRAQIVTFLWKANGEPEATEIHQMSDVPESAFYYKAVQWAIEKGITSGTKPGMFSPNDPCTRGQIVTFLYKSR